MSFIAIKKQSEVDPLIFYFWCYFKVNQNVWHSHELPEKSFFDCLDEVNFVDRPESSVGLRHYLEECDSAPYVYGRDEVIA
jgi:hypothetical protein